MGGAAVTALQIGRAPSLQISGSAFYGNTSVNGAAVSLFGQSTITNSTFTSNVSETRGAAISAGGAQDLMLVGATVDGNRLTGSGAGGAGVYASSPGRSVTLENSIVAQNSASTDPDIEVSGTPATAQFSLVGDTGGSGIVQNAAHDNILGSRSTGLVNPQLSPLAANGGSTKSMLPKAGSPVVEGRLLRGHDGPARQATDRRLPVDSGTPPAGDGTDIGAVERGAPVSSRWASFGNQRPTLGVPSTITCTPGRDPLAVSFISTTIKNSRTTKMAFRRVQIRVDHGVNWASSKNPAATGLILRWGSGPHTVYARATYTYRARAQPDSDQDRLRQVLDLLNRDRRRPAPIASRECCQMALTSCGFGLARHALRVGGCRESASLGLPEQRAGF